MNDKTIVFIKKANKKHVERYDYSKVGHVNNRTKVIIICRDHGEFMQNPEHHLRGQGCSKCSGTYMDTEYFIKISKQIHGKRYNYSKVKYINSKTKITIICNDHGEFVQIPSSHLNGNGCNKCSGNYMDNIYFIKKAKNIHKDKYNYSKTEYINSRTKIIIICNKHGKFMQTPNSHLNGKGCPKCGVINCSNKLSHTTSTFIKKANKLHNGQYNYSKVKYINSKTKVTIICEEHGEFIQRPDNHLRGQGCRKCSGKYMDNEFFIKKAKQVHRDKYDYSKVEYINCRTKVIIICKDHGEFIQRPENHLRGQGCSKCGNIKCSKKLLHNTSMFIKKLL